MGLVVAAKEDYASDNFLKAIRSAREIRKHSCSEDFNINFSFTYKASSLNEFSLNADGYFLKYYANT